MIRFVWLSVVTAVFPSLMCGVVSAQINCKDPAPWPAEYRQRIHQQVLAEKDNVANRENELRLNPTSAEAHFNLAEAYLQCLSCSSDRTEKAFRGYSEAIRLKPDYAEAYKGLAVIYGWRNEFRKPFATLKKAVEIKPDYAEAYSDLGFAHLWSNTTKESEYPDFNLEMNLAIEAFQSAIRIKPDFARAYQGLGEAYSSLNRYQESIAAYKRAIEINPADGKAPYDLGSVYLNAGQMEDAAAEYRALRHLDEVTEDILAKCLCGRNAEVLLSEIEKRPDTKRQ